MTDQAGPRLLIVRDEESKKLEKNVNLFCMIKNQESVLRYIFLTVFT